MRQQPARDFVRTKLGVIFDNLELVKQRANHMAGGYQPRPPAILFSLAFYFTHTRLPFVAENGSTTAEKRSLRRDNIHVALESLRRANHHMTARNKERNAFRS